MRNKLLVLMVLLSSVLLSGCIFEPQEKLLPVNYDQTNITIKYVVTSSILDKNDFPDFNLKDHIYFVYPENLSLTLDTESLHGTGAVDATNEIPKGYRIYGSEEAYNSSKRFILLQYKVFDNDGRLNDSMNLTATDYINHGFKSKILNGTYKGRIFALENETKDMNITIILFGYDTIIGKIGVQDYKDMSLNESLKILDIVEDRLKINTKQVQVSNTFESHQRSGI
jgi:hypothetical protein